jgi:hypothetical protein
LVVVVVVLMLLLLFFLLDLGFLEEKEERVW